MKRILVIEDEAPLREGILELLAAEGFETIAAANGQQGLQLAQEKLPDLILCDVLMPILDGYQTLEALRQNPQTALIPFIFLTAKGTARDFRQGLRLGADDYLLKPFERRELLEAINTRLKRQAALGKLQRKVMDLQQSNLLKDDCFSMLSHELRSPLINILATVQLLQTVPDVSNQQRYLGMLHDECSREITLLNDLLDLQRLEANVYQPLLERLNLYMWVPAIAEPFEVRAGDRQQQLEIDLAPDLPLFWSDCTDLRRILSELLNNACKYTPTGGKIVLNVWCNRSAGSICFCISNETEIPDAELPHVFDRFYRVVSVDFHQQGGSGLGLPLVKKLVEQLGGSLTVESRAGWTTFVAQMPV